MTQATAAPGQNAPVDKHLPADSAEIVADKNQSGQQTTPHASATSKAAGNEEPELLLEPDLPSDGRDEIGEAMILDLPQRPELSEPPSQPNPA
ncbi:MAG: hypothetical protein ABIR56_09090 [Polaromonas sp.]